MQNIIEQVYDFNQQAGLLGKGYSDTLESAFQIEEALEGFNIYPLAERFGCDAEPKLMARAFMSEVDGELSDVDRLDKACDAVIFALGSMAKLGLTPSQIERALSTVTAANLQKLGMPRDEKGKLMKPDNYIGPEAALQQILEE
jgi:hypothetical protein